MPSCALLVLTPRADHNSEQIFGQRRQVRVLLRGDMSYESTAEPIKIGYLMDFMLPADYPQHLRDDLTNPFDMVFGDALEHIRLRALDPLTHASGRRFEDCRLRLFWLRRHARIPAFRLLEV